MTTKMNNHRFWACIALVALVAGCGGGGGGGSEPADLSGKLDPSYGVAGTVRAAAGAVAVEFALDGTAYPYGLALTKIDANGAHVASFGGGAPVLLDPSGDSSIALDESSNVFYTFDSGIAKLDPNGFPVHTFGDGGRFLVGARGPIANWQLARCAANNLYLGTFERRGQQIQDAPKQAVLKVAPAGTAAAYGSGGIASLPFEEIPETVLMRTDADGSLFVTSSSFAHRQHVVAKLNPIGQTNLQFGTNGVWVNDTCPTFEATAMRSDGGGNVVVAGYCGASGPETPLVLKLDNLGRSEAFREGGRRAGIFGDGARGQVVDVLPERSGEVYVAGYRLNANGCAEATVAKVDGNGNAVEAFGTRGLVVLRPGSGSSVAVKLAKDFLGRLYVVSSVSPSCDSTARGSTAPLLDVHRLGG